MYPKYKDLTCWLKINKNQRFDEVLGSNMGLEIHQD